MEGTRLMNLYSQIKKTSLFMSGILILIGHTQFAFATTQSGQVQPPQKEVLDSFGVNLTTGQVSTSLQTVSIGGSMGLSHSISMQANLFSITGLYGYIDKFAGSVRYTKIGENVKADTYTAEVPQLYVMRASGPTGSADFKINYSNSTYESLGDKRELLAVNSAKNYLIWTRPDGTELWYPWSSGMTITSSTSLKYVIYPNGLKITIHGKGGVTTNTGFQLKYDYVDDTRPMDPAKLSVYVHPNSRIPALNTSAASYWSNRNAKYVRAINNAYEYCDPAYFTSCTLTSEWPTATFNWPAGMPRAIFLGDSVFSVVDAEGRSTDYHYRSFDLSLRDVHNPNSHVSCTTCLQPGEDYSPRLVGIKPANSDEIDVTYDYQNVYTTRSPADTGVSVGIRVVEMWQELTSRVGELRNADSKTLGHAGYSIGSQANQGGDFWNFGHWTGKGEPIRTYLYRDMPGVLYWVQSLEKGYFEFERSYRNFVVKTNLIGEPTKKYFYDTRGNLKHIELFDGTSTSLGKEYEALYPTTCSNTKTCNSPIWTKDANGNQTDYTYHAESGQLATITGPANANNVRPQTRYGYTKKYAQYKISSNSVTTSTDGIYLLSSEKFCANSAYNGTACSGNDEVSITYEYSTGNLLQVGKAVTADAKTLRTCYSYDKYGNRIGETQPAANLTTCL